MSLPPINHSVYSITRGDDIESPENLSDCMRVLLIILYRLNLISYDAAVIYVIPRQRLKDFGKRHFFLYKKS